MLKAGTQIVGGVNARKAGTTVSHIDKDGKDVELPVFGTVVEAIEKTGADVSIIFVPPKFAKDAIIEAIDAEIPLLVVITEGIPVQDSAYAWAYNVSKGNKTRIIGPNCPGIITPGESLVGITPANITGPGPIGLVSKSGTLTYQMMFELRDFGFSTAIGIGGDPVIGTTHIDAIEAFEKDPDTKVIVMIGEIGGDAEERAADYIKANVSKPVVGYVAGFTAPEGKTMGHAGAIVSGSSGTAAAKKEALEAAGVKVGKTPSETAGLAREILQEPLAPSRERVCARQIRRTLGARETVTRSAQPARFDPIHPPTSISLTKFALVSERRRNQCGCRQEVLAAECSSVDPRTPVIVGVGQFTENIDDPGYRGMSAVELATEAARAALTDTGADVAAVAKAIDVVVGLRQFEISGPMPAKLGKSNNYPRSVMRRRRRATRPARCWNPSAGRARRSWSRSSATRSRRARADVVMLIGSEAGLDGSVLRRSGRQTRLHRARRRAARGSRPPDSSTTSASTPLTHGLTGAPVQYGLLDNARRGRLGLSVAEYRQTDGRAVRAVLQSRCQEPVFVVSGRALGSGDRQRSPTTIG